MGSLSRVTRLSGLAFLSEPESMRLNTERERLNQEDVHAINTCFDDCIHPFVRPV